MNFNATSSYTYLMYAYHSQPIPSLVTLSPLLFPFIPFHVHAKLELPTGT